MQRCYGGVRLIEGGPCLKNVERLDAGALPMIAQMQRTGLQTNLDHFRKMDKILTEDMDMYTEQVRDMTGYYLNLGSGDQVADLLFKKLKLKQARPKMTKSGDRESVEDEVLTAIQHEHPVIGILQNYKEVEKLRGTYVRPMLKLAVRVAPGHWRMFPNFRDTRVPSGRLACSDPNLLAIPARTKRGRQVKEGFEAASGYKLVSVDLSQIEPRVAAHRSKDPNLLKVYREGQDIYSDFATPAFQLEDKRYYDADKRKWIYPTVDAMDHRRPSKTCVLASFYQVTAGGLLEQMPVVCRNCKVDSSEHYEKGCKRFAARWSENGCQDLLNTMLLRYDQIPRMWQRDNAVAMRDARAYDMWGRQLHVAAVRSILPWVVAAALREVGNFPMQSGSQGILKIAMAASFDDLLEAGLTLEDDPLGSLIRPVLQVHDELILECRDDLVEDCIAMVQWRCETAVRLDVPLKAGGAYAQNWGTLEK